MNYSNYTKIEIIEDIISNSISLNEIPQKWKNDKSIGLLILKNYVDSFEHLSDELKDDKDVVLEALTNSFCLDDVSERLRDDKDVVIKAMEFSFISLIYASERLQNDKELLEMLEKQKEYSLKLQFDEAYWYKERMEVLELLRDQEDKNIIEESIVASKLKNKKNKF